MAPNSSGLQWRLEQKSYTLRAILDWPSSYQAVLRREERMSFCPWATIINHGTVAINLNLLRSAFRACCRNIEQNGGLKHLGQIEYYFVSVLLFPFVGIVSDSCSHINTRTICHLNPTHNHAFARGNLYDSVTLLLLSRLPSLAGWAFLHHTFLGHQSL